MIDACHATPGGDRAGDVRAVVVIIPGVVVAIDEVPAADVVDLAVAIVVGLVAGDLTRVAPDVRRQVRVIPGHAAVDHGHHGRRTPLVAVPRLRRVDVGVGRAHGAVDGLAGVVQAPQVAEMRVVGRGRRGVIDPVGLGVANVGALLQLRDRVVDALAALDLHQLRARGQQVPLGAHLGGRPHRRALRRIDPGPEAHHDLARHRRRPRRGRRMQRRLGLRRARGRARRRDAHGRRSEHHDHHTHQPPDVQRAQSTPVDPGSVLGPALGHRCSRSSAVGHGMKQTSAR
jgi:hypothetical protein